MSETPRTDAHATPKGEDGTDWINANFARQLERENAALREQLAERDAEIVALKGHAEAMAERLDAWARIDECKCSEVDAYRRDFPKEEK